MYGDDFKARLNIQQVCSFLLTGAEMMEIDQGSPEERHLRYSNALVEGMKNFRDLVVGFNWTNLSEKEKDFKTEEMWSECAMASWDENRLYFQMGFTAGFQLGREFSGML